MYKTITILIMLGFIMLIIYGFFQRYHIKKHSERYGQFLNVRNQFEKELKNYKNNFFGSYAFDTKQKYDNPNNRNSTFKEYLLKNKYELETAIDTIHHNRELQDEFNIEYKELELLPELDKYKWVERKLLKDLLDSIKLNDDFRLHFKCSYTSPKGQNHYECKRRLSLDELTKELQVMEEEKDERTEYEIFRDAERAKMTSGLRYDILKRDNFTCRMCGANSNTHGITLHVDHIKPVFDGGVTKKENLQTLCRDCNLGKGTKE